jgi:dUTP pyrophosphatase
MSSIDIVRLEEDIPLPHRPREGDAGYDLVSRIDLLIEPGQRVTIPTGISIHLPPGLAGLVLPRSGLARRWGLGIVNSPGLIDPGYTGEISILFQLHGPEPLQIKRLDRCGQLLLLPFASAQWVEVEGHLSSQRGELGFGSSG